MASDPRVMFGVHPCCVCVARKLGSPVPSLWSHVYTRASFHVDKDTREGSPCRTQLWWGFAPCLTPRPPCLCTCRLSSVLCARGRLLPEPLTRPLSQRTPTQLLCSHGRCPLFRGTLQTGPPRACLLAPTPPSPVPSTHLCVRPHFILPGTPGASEVLGHEDSGLNPKLCTEIDPLMMTSFSRTECFVPEGHTLACQVLGPDRINRHQPQQGSWSLALRGRPAVCPEASCFTSVGSVSSSVQWGY